MDVSEPQIKRIVLNRLERCSVCHHLYEPDDIRVITRKPAMWTLLVECTECPARNFVAAVLQDGDPEEAQRTLRELSRSSAFGDEFPSVPEPVSPPVSTDDLLDLHEYLADFDGDFRKLFGA
ncbi:MAG: hypothetical protein AVDCRST_MAG73-599 [uncultured Thermomicrobiales bacterium]|uniref:Uncharacterized protein n=1 Tax=uncultured Thermomicrobiales bacterium TaxID=1645740 RepID=A0A6J4TME5_9BACT|nr:MAG: hypothetical protein AVDCRST_MAG73-599 [uncultured Thermomicrobiales bacterium]